MPPHCHEEVLKLVLVLFFATYSIQSGPKFGLELAFDRASVGGCADSKISKGQAFQNVGATRHFRGLWMCNSLLRLELYTSQKQILREHIDDLTGRMVLQPLSKGPTAIAPGHPDVETLLVIEDDVYARLGRD